jgi:hypothetical protein
MLWLGAQALDPGLDVVGQAFVGRDMFTQMVSPPTGGHSTQPQDAPMAGLAPGGVAMIGVLVLLGGLSRSL